MSKFIQVHALIQFPAGNPNRDDQGRPKTVVMGGHNRLRISSQALKHAWRVSDTFRTALAGNLGVRTARVGRIALDRLVAAGMEEKKAVEAAAAIAGVFGKVGGKKGDEKALDTAAMVFLAAEELAAVEALCDVCAAESRVPDEDELSTLRVVHRSADVHLWGRMFADNPAMNTEAVCQVAHAITVHKAAVEDDFFTALDDLNEEDNSSAHIGEQELGAGLFYLYVCLDKAELTERLGAELAGKTVAALLECVLTVVPSGKQNSFATRPLAGFAMVEKGDVAPRTLATAFSRPVTGGGEGMMKNAIAALKGECDALDDAYGARAAERAVMEVGGLGSLAALREFAL